jgi:peptidyl-prolyl cis-trans isomerase C
LSAEQRHQVLDALVNGEVVAQQAGKDGLDKEKDVQSMLGMARLEILQRALQQKYLKDKVPTDAELRAEYDVQITQMPHTEYHARHILVPTKERADAITEQLRKGGNFAQIATKESIDTSKAQGGDLGWFAPGSMVKPFADALVALKKGQITPAPVQTQFGWHIIKLEDTREVTPPTFEASKQQVLQFVMGKKFKAYTDELLKAAKVEKKL